MKKMLLSMILVCLVFTGCHRQTSAQIVATTLPVWEFTEAICRDTNIHVSRLITEEVSCLHDYTVQVWQMRAVASAQAVVCNGAGLETFLEDVLTDADYVIDASQDVSLSCSHSHGEHHHEHDAHIWMSPENAKEMCKTICAELSVLYPEQKDRFEVNLSELLNKLDALQHYGEKTLKHLNTRDLITFHDGFSYFANSFQLHIVRSVEEESGSEASAQELTELIEFVKNSQLPAIFTEKSGSTAAAEVIARETGAAVYALDMGMSGNSYFDAMYHNIDTIKEALG